MSATASSMVFAEKPSRLPRWVNTLLVIVLGWAVAVLVMKLIPEPATDYRSNVATAPAGAVNKTADPSKMAQITAGLHLFGDASTAPVVKKEEKKEVKVAETGLNLELAGVFAYYPAEKAIAIISQGSEQSAYGIGDKIVGEVTLEEVHKDHVILNNRGKSERLKLPENVQPIAMRQVQQPSNQAQPNPNDSGGGQADGQQGGEIVLPTTPGALRDTLARNPSMLGRIVAAEPYQENGKLVGYRITPKQNPEILEAQGIVAGDVITRVNNIQLNSQKQGIRALRNAVKAQALEVTVLRDGVEVPLSISLAQ